MIYEQTPLLQNMDRNKTGMFGVYISSTEVEIFGSEYEEKTHFEKTACNS